MTFGLGLGLYFMVGMVVCVIAFKLDYYREFTSFIVFLSFWPVVVFIMFSLLLEMLWDEYIGRFGR